MLPVQALMRAAGDPERAAGLMRFFKTGPGEYGQGDRFLGLKVPETRSFLGLCRPYSLAEVLELLRSEFHEERLLAVLELGRRYRRSPEAVLEAYLANTRYVNNWDLVDSSAAQIVGEHGDAELLDRLAASESLWERRIAVVATLALIRRGRFEDTLRLCERLLGDKHDLMHKACGWMLREVGKKDLTALLGFLELHAGRMPRTMLRYALEKLPPEQREFYMRYGAAKISPAARDNTDMSGLRRM